MRPTDTAISMTEFLKDAKTLREQADFEDLLSALHKVERQQPSRIKPAVRRLIDFLAEEKLTSKDNRAAPSVYQAQFNRYAYAVAASMLLYSLAFIKRLQHKFLVVRDKDTWLKSRHPDSRTPLVSQVLCQTYDALHLALKRLSIS